jgi:GDP-L-fucose synthase
LAAPSYSLDGKRIWVAGHKGMVGSALVRRLAAENCTILTADRSDLDLIDKRQVDSWLSKNRPDAVILAAAKVGGILANQDLPAEFIYQNLMIEANVINGAHCAGVEKLVFLGSSCIYPKFAEQPIKEEALLSGPLEPTNEWYAIAKIAGIKLAQAYRRQHGCDFISAMPTNLYGPNDNFDLASSHVLPALIRKAHEAKLGNADEMVIWGSGSPLREFLHVDDCADACCHLLSHYSDEGHVNVGSGQEISILSLAELIASIVGFEGKIVTDPTKPDGTPRKLMDNSKLAALGWEPSIALAGGIASTYEYFLRSHSDEKSKGSIH